MSWVEWTSVGAWDLGKKRLENGENHDINWHQSWMDMVLSNSNKLIGLDNLYDEMAEYLDDTGGKG